MSLKSRITPDHAVFAGLLLTAGIYLQDLRYDFVIDDVPLILLNQATLTWQNVKTVFTTDVFFEPGPHIPTLMSAVHYRPIFMLWLMVNQQLFGSVFPWWHLTSLLLHLCVVFLVYQLAVNILKERWTAALAAMLFAFHPIHVESVSYVSASTDLLVALFLLLSFLCYWRFREQGASPAYLAVAVFTAALAMLCKETTVMFPWILISYEALRERPSGTKFQWTQFVWTLPFFAVVGMYGIVRTLLLGDHLGSRPGGIRLSAFADAPLVLITYFRNLLWSVQLSFFYPYEWASKWTFLKGCAVVLLAAASLWLWNRYRNRPGLRMQILWMAILFVPVLLAISAFDREDWVHDRHMYLVSVPFSLLVAALLADAKVPRNASLIASAVILAVLGVETAVQVPRFSDGVSVFESALRVAPHDALAHRDYAVALCSYGRCEDALPEYRIAAELAPNNPTSYGSYGEALSIVGRNEEAVAQYAKALQITPRSSPYRPFLLYRLAAIKVSDSEPVEGEAYLREAIQLDPFSPNYHAILADALRQQGRTNEASQEMQLQAILQKNPSHAAAVPGQ